jgi:hypothetical protein
MSSWCSEEDCVRNLQSKVSADTWAYIGEKKLKELHLDIGPFLINGVQLVHPVCMEKGLPTPRLSVTPTGPTKCHLPMLPSLQRLCILQRPTPFTHVHTCTATLWQINEHMKYRTQCHTRQGPKQHPRQPDGVSTQVWRLISIPQSAALHAHSLVPPYHSQLHCRYSHSFSLSHSISIRRASGLLVRRSRA